MDWLILLLAELPQTAWAVGLKYAHGFTRFWPSLFTILAMTGSVWLLAVATCALPLGTAYTAWTNIGAAALGILLFGESGEIPPGFI